MRNGVGERKKPGTEGGKEGRRERRNAWELNHVVGRRLRFAKYRVAKAARGEHTDARVAFVVVGVRITCVPCYTWRRQRARMSETGARIQYLSRSRGISRKNRAGDN